MVLRFRRRSENSKNKKKTKLFVASVFFSICLFHSMKTICSFERFYLIFSAFLIVYLRFSLSNSPLPLSSFFPPSIFPPFFCWLFVSLFPILSFPLQLFLPFHSFKRVSFVSSPALPIPYISLSCLYQGFIRPSPFLLVLVL